MYSKDSTDVAILSKMKPEDKTPASKTKMTVFLDEEDDGTVVMWATGVVKGSNELYYTKRYSLPATFKGFSDKLTKTLCDAMHDKVFSKSSESK